MSSSDNPDLPVFKKKSRPQGLSAKRKLESEDDPKDDNDQPEQSIDELREMQRLKKLLTQPRGVNVSSLLESSKKQQTNPVRRKELEGLTDAKSIKAELDLGNTFSVETNRRDEDAEMAKFIEQELAKRKGLTDDGANTSSKARTVEDLVYNELPQHLLSVGGSKKTEEMLSTQMLSGIPEIDLGFEEKVRNFDATEEAKKKLYEARLRSRSRNDKDNDFIPTNVAVNFNQVNRSKVLDLRAKSQQAAKTSISVIEEPVVVLGDEPRAETFTQSSSHERMHPGHLKATDDYHYEKFRKQHRKK